MLGNNTLLCTRRRLGTEPALSVSFLNRRVDHRLSGVGRAFEGLYSVRYLRSKIIFRGSDVDMRRVALGGRCGNIQMRIGMKLSATDRIVSVSMNFNSVVAPTPISLSCPILLSALPRISVLTCSLRAIITRGCRTVVSRTARGDHVGSFFSICEVLGTKGVSLGALRRTVATAFRGENATVSARCDLFRSSFTASTGQGVV